MDETEVRDLITSPLQKDVQPPSLGSLQGPQSSLISITQEQEGQKEEVGGGVG